MENKQTTEIDQNQAIQILIDVANLAQSKGMFTFDESELVHKAIKAFVSTQPTQQTIQE